MENLPEKAITQEPGATTINTAKTVVEEDLGEIIKTVPEPDEVEIHSNAALAHNPVLTAEDEADDELKLLRGDAIGNTLYSERFLLSNLLKLSKVKKEDTLEEGFENELCSLWDMTIEEDVVNMLLKYDIYDLFAQVISLTDDNRLTEILLGILGNMCYFECAREKLMEHHELVLLLLQLTGCSDALALLQLMRLLSVMFIYADSDTTLKWYQNILLMPEFIDNISFILNESINEDLLRQTMETLNAILKKLAEIDSEFIEMFVTEKLVRATIEAFGGLLADEDSSCLSSQANQKFVQTFLNIHCILIQNELSTESFETCKLDIMNCIYIILKPFCEVDDMSLFGKVENDLLEGVNDLLLELHDPYHETCFTRMLVVWNLLRKEMERWAHIESKAIEFEEDEPDSEFNLVANYQYFLNSLVRMINGASKTQVVDIVKVNITEDILNLVNIIRKNDKKEMKICHERIVTAIKEIGESK